MKVLFIGDVVGEPGREAVRALLPELMRDEAFDFVIANGENAAGGVGITYETAQHLYDAGVDAITLGNHAWDRREALHLAAEDRRIVRPANYPPGAPGNGGVVLRVRDGLQIGIINLCGRVFSVPNLDCPFRTADALIETLSQETKCIIVDMHAEATSEKSALGWYLDGRVSAVLGTHTHVQTADERILPRGTAYITDVGMTGPRDSVIGMKRELVVERFLNQLPVRFEVAQGEAIFSALSLEIDNFSGRATGVRRISRILP
ncbi:MAG: TIGR00282 family metallophosphoesterase [Chloroflexota bacterium]